MNNLLCMVGLLVDGGGTTTTTTERIHTYAVKKEYLSPSRKTMI